MLGHEGAAATSKRCVKNGGYRGCLGFWRRGADRVDHVHDAAAGRRAAGRARRKSAMPAASRRPWTRQTSATGTGCAEKGPIARYIGAAPPRPRMRWALHNHASFSAMGAIMAAVLAAPVGGQLHSSFVFDVVGGEGGNALVLTNNGMFQVTGMLLSGTIPGAQPVDGCAEGRVTVAGNGSIRSEFDRMTPGMPCRLAVVGDDPVDLSGIAITADGFTGVWTVDQSELPSRIAALFWSWWGAVFFAVVIAQVLLLYAMYDALTKIIGAAIGWYWKRTEKEIRRPRAAPTVVRHVRAEYGTNISLDEGSVLVLLVCGKDTLGQLEQHTGMRRSHIRHLIKRLRRKRLIDPVRIVPIRSLAFLACAGDLCGDVRPKYKQRH